MKNRGLMRTVVDQKGLTIRFVKDKLYINNRDGTFSDISHPARIADYRSSMGIAVGDWNGDGRQDLFLTPMLCVAAALGLATPMSIMVGVGRGAPNPASTGTPPGRNRMAARSIPPCTRPTR